MRTKCRINNRKATQLLKQLYQNKSKHELIKNASVINQQAFDIYNQINEQPNHYVINTILKVFLNTNKPGMISKIWSQCIEIENVSYPLILKCLISTNNPDFNKNCIEILQLIQDKKYNMNKYEITYYSLSVSKLITLFQTKQELDSIHDLILQIDHNDIHIYTALINAYCKCHDTQQAENIFHDIPDQHKDI